MHEKELQERVDALCRQKKELEAKLAGLDLKEIEVSDP